MRRCCRLGWLVREGDTKEEASAKTVLFPFAVFITLLSIASTFHILATTNQVVLVFAYSLVGFSFLLFLVGVVTNAVPVVYLIDILLIVSAVGLSASDLGQATRSSPLRTWSFVVLLVDVALFFNRRHMVWYIIVPVLLWMYAINVESVEGWGGFGLYDLGYWGTEGTEISKCNCASPPCSVDVINSFLGAVGITLVLLGDYYFTSRFADGLRFQLRRVEAAVEVAEEIAAALAMYDIDAAEKSILNGSDLPEGLAESFRRLLGNLALYRNYLPEALLGSGTDMSGSVVNTITVPPPGQDDGVEVGMLFTDIQSSTALWEAYMGDMYDALRTHNTVLRKVAYEHSGYEVKIIGDALMLAFDDATNAVNFGTQAQLELVQSQWPPSLCEHPLCQRVEGPAGVPLWQGLRVRIGIHWGPVRAERNPVTGRFDYFGSTVNAASRVEAALKDGGLTGVSQPVLDQVGAEHIKSMFVTSYGKKELKGIAEPVSIFILLPTPLAARWGSLQAPSPVSPPRNPMRAPLPSDTRSQAPSPLLTLDLGYGSAFRRRSSADLLALRSNTSHLSPDREGSPVRGRTMHSSDFEEQYKTLGLGLTSSTCTAATVRGCFTRMGEEEATYTVTEVVVGVETASLRTGGQVVCVVSASCVLAWNAGVRCTDHLSQSAHFLTLLQGAEGSSRETHVGIATGRALSGNVGSKRRRYVTVVGGAVELSLALAESAALRGVTFMAAGAIGIHLAGEGGVTKQERWVEEGGIEVEVWEEVRHPVHSFGDTTPERDRAETREVELVERPFALSFGNLL
eukprot:Hpha_TRINITY_DN16693_c2_g12::TRINITY_DN16693_c2_g12_i1::g.180621::m.180621